MAKFTPGPWKLYMVSGCANVHVGETHNCVEHFSPEQIIAEWTGYKYIGEDGLARWTMRDEDRANARLIAAAPLMYEALKALYETAIEAGSVESLSAYMEAIDNAEVALQMVEEDE